MDREDILQILKRSNCSPNLDSALRLCIKRIGESQEIHIGEPSQDGLPAAHFFEIYSNRLKNPNGVALRTPGLIESVGSFNREAGLLRMISIKLDSDAIAIWITEDDRIVGCIKFLSELEINCARGQV